MIPLRDRIADLLAHHPAFNLKDDGYSAEDVLRMADAVIRELNLAADCATGCMWQIPRHVEDMTPKQRELLERGTDQ